VWAFLPQAASAEVMLAEGPAPMTRKHPQGLFVAQIEGEPRADRLRATLHSGSVVEFEDPYRFQPQLSAFDLHLHGEGTHHETYNTLGAHLVESEGVPGVRFAVWAPNARSVAVVGDFNSWDGRLHPMRSLGSSGIWELFIPGRGRLPTSIKSAGAPWISGEVGPYATRCECPPKRRRSSGS
jgi:1,4-alpha-glucan branching enzyme